MAKKIGRVTSITADGRAMVITERGDACNNCESTQFCHSLADCSRLETSVLNQAGAGVGDRVTIALSSNMVFKGAFVLYIIPVEGLLCGAITGTGLSQYLAINETAAGILFGFGGLVSGFITTGLISRRFMSKNQLTPVITRIIKRTMGSYG